MPTCSQCDVYRTLLTSAHFCHLEARFAHLRGSSSGPRSGVFSLVLAHFPSQALFGCLLNLQASLQSIFGNLRRSNLRDFNALASNRLAVRVRRIAQLGHQLYTGSAWAGPDARRRFLSDVPFGRFPLPSLAMYPLVRFDCASLAMYPLVGFDGASLAMYPSVGVDGAFLAMHLLVGCDGASLAMYPSVAFDGVSLLMCPVVGFA